MRPVAEATLSRWAVIMLLLTAGCGSQHSADEYSVGMAESPMAFESAAGGEQIGVTEDSAVDSEAVPSPDAALETERQLIYVADVRLVVEDFAAVAGKNGISQLVEKYGGHTADLTIDRNQGQIESAFQHIDQALQIDPQDFDSLLIKADLLLYQRQGEAAYAMLKPLYENHQSNRHYISALARAAGLTGKREEALELQKRNQELIKEDDLRPSSLQSDTVEKKQAQHN